MTLSWDAVKFAVAVICVLMLIGVLGITEKALVALILASQAELKMTWKR